MSIVPDGAVLAPAPPGLLDAVLPGPDTVQTASGGVNATAAPVFADAHLLKRARARLQKIDIPHPEKEHGQDASTQLLKAANDMIVGFNLDDDTTVILLREWDGNRYPEKEYRRKCQDARKKPHFPKNHPAVWGYLLTEDQMPSANGHHAGNGYEANGTVSGGVAYGSVEIKKKPKKIHHRRFDTIEVKAIKWLFKNRIPLGKVTVLDGDPDLGKSTLMLDFGARVTGAGNGFSPDGSPIECGVADILIMSGEDEPEDTIRPRLDLAGADVTRCHFIDEILDGDEVRPLEIPRDLPEIEAIIKEHGIKLWVIDPLFAFLSDCDANTDQSIRKVLHKLGKIATRTGCAIVLQRHWNKSSNPKAMHRGGGSIAISAHARSALMVCPDPDDETKRLLAVVKKNRGGVAPTLRFCLDPVEVELAGEPDTICRIGWCGTSPYQANQLTQQPNTEKEKQDKEDEKTKFAQAQEILTDLLTEGLGKIVMKEAKAVASNAGISFRTLQRAAEKLQLAREHEGKGKDRVDYWVQKDVA